VSSKRRTGEYALTSTLQTVFNPCPAGRRARPSVGKRSFFAIVCAHHRGQDARAPLFAEHGSAMKSGSMAPALHSSSVDNDFHSSRKRGFRDESGSMAPALHSGGACPMPYLEFAFILPFIQNSPENLQASGVFTAYCTRKRTEKQGETFNHETLEIHKRRFPVQYPEAVWRGGARGGTS